MTKVFVLVIAIYPHTFLLKYSPWSTDGAHFALANPISVVLIAVKRVKTVFRLTSTI